MLVSFIGAAAAEPVSTNSIEAAQWDRIYKRVAPSFAKDGITNRNEVLNNPWVKAAIVHPAFGISWNEMPPPTSTNSAAMSSVDSFIATNGWNMHTGRVVGFSEIEHKKWIQGLPWTEIENRRFRAITHNGILYVVLKSWQFDASGVAFNPGTNRFPAAIRGFKPLGNHWYAWMQPEFPSDHEQVYEGQPDGRGSGEMNDKGSSRPGGGSK